MIIKELRAMHEARNFAKENKFLTMGQRNLFGKHGKTILPHDALPLDLKNLTKPGYD